MAEQNHDKTRQNLKRLAVDLQKRLIHAQSQVVYHRRELDEETHRVHVLNTQYEQVLLAEGVLRTLDESGITLKPKVTASA